MIGAENVNGICLGLGLSKEGGFLVLEHFAQPQNCFELGRTVMRS
jgi:hypothetical protein